MLIRVGAASTRVGVGRRDYEALAAWLGSGSGIVTPRTYLLLTSR